MEEMEGDKTQAAKWLPNKLIGILNVSPGQLTWQAFMVVGHGEKGR